MISNRRAENKPQIVPTAVPIIEVFTNPEPEREYEIEISCPEFTSVCPKTGQPDFGELLITYAPRKTCIELKSLKLYLQQFRNTGIFYEAATNKILDDLAKACAPRWMTVVSQWQPRGGISTKVAVRYARKERKKK
jgi:7-cyano-7-deazaguanine reductase